MEPGRYSRGRRSQPRPRPGPRMISTVPEGDEDCRSRTKRWNLDGSAVSWLLSALILCALNVMGKTQLLRMPQVVFNGRDAALRQIPFREFQILTSNRQTLSVRKNETSPTAPLQFTLTRKGEPPQTFSMAINEPEQ